MGMVSRFLMGGVKSGVVRRATGRSANVTDRDTNVDTSLTVYE
ncbi:hypothetical protein [Haladaptatus sp. W1]|nr:hypothetical protein [Haladaptatus sp. W1]